MKAVCHATVQARICMLSIKSRWILCIHVHEQTSLTNWESSVQAYVYHVYMHAPSLSIFGLVHDHDVHLAKLCKPDSMDQHNTGY